MVATTEERSSGAVPSLGLIAVVGAVVIATVIFIAYATSGPSDADLYARAQAGDAEAGEILIAKYAEATPKSIVIEGASFTSGAYRKANSGATNGGDVIASFLFFIAEGELEEALALTESSKDVVSEFISSRLLYDGNLSETGNLLRNAEFLVVSDLKVIGEGAIPSESRVENGKEYYATVATSFDSNPIIIIFITRNEGGVWKVSGGM